MSADTKLGITCPGQRENAAAVPSATPQTSRSTSTEEEEDPTIGRSMR
jgi:hypothetical protein